jgi:DNA-binding transcriptional LysR family regulator
MTKHLLSDIALFIEVVHGKSFTKAAERLDMPASTLSRRVSALETTIGFRLLNRTTRKVEVTEEGAAYFRRCKHLVEEATLAHEEISETIHVASGVLRLACTPDFANLYLAPVLTRFSKENPAVSVEPARFQPCGKAPWHIEARHLRKPRFLDVLPGTDKRAARPDDCGLHSTYFQ